jgi:hypothetical protein
MFFVQAVSLFAHCLQPTELELITFQSEQYYLARDRYGRQRLLSARSVRADASLMYRRKG